MRWLMWSSCPAVLLIRTSTSKVNKVWGSRFGYSFFQVQRLWYCLDEPWQQAKFSLLLDDRLRAYCHCQLHESLHGLVSSMVHQGILPCSRVSGPNVIFHHLLFLKRIPIIWAWSFLAVAALCNFWISEKPSPSLVYFLCSRMFCWTQLMSCVVCRSFERKSFPDSKDSSVRRGWRQYKQIADWDCCRMKGASMGLRSCPFLTFRNMQMRRNRA